LASGSSRIPAVCRIAATVDGSRVWFLGAKASMQGAMTASRARSSPSQR